MLVASKPKTGRHSSIPSRPNSSPVEAVGSNRHGTMIVIKPLYSSRIVTLALTVSFYGWSVLFFVFQVVRARRVLTESTVVCARRRLGEPGAHSVCYDCAALCMNVSCYGWSGLS